MKIPFNRAFTIGNEIQYIQAAVERGALSGDGFFTKKCHEQLQSLLGCAKVLLTNSCTAALEMAAILANIQPGDEVIMPSYTFVSTANAFVLRGGVPVFVDIRPDTLNIDENKIVAAITNKTKAIVPVHYAGVACEMDTIMEIANNNNLLVIEDAAQAIMSSYKGKKLGTIGHLATLSFHETKNIIAGEGGALLINDPEFIDRAEIIREKGTNRSHFFRGQVDKYSWVDIGSSYLPGELIAAFLLAQLENADMIIAKRRKLWNRYWDGLVDVAKDGQIDIPSIPKYSQHNAHMFYIKMPNLSVRSALLNELNNQDVGAVFHYVPLHSAEAGKRYGRFHGLDEHTTRESERLVRLPMFYSMTEDEVDCVVSSVKNFTRRFVGRRK